MNELHGSGELSEMLAGASIAHMPPIRLEPSKECDADENL